MFSCCFKEEEAAFFLRISDGTNSGWHPERRDVLGLGCSLPGLVWIGQNAKY